MPGEKGDPEEPAFVALKQGNIGIISADLIPTYSANGWAVIGTTIVVNHGDAWSICVDSRDRDASLKVRTFGSAESGTLVVDPDRGFGVFVRDGGGCG